jgi:surface antigen
VEKAALHLVWNENVLLRIIRQMKYFDLSGDKNVFKEEAMRLVSLFMVGLMMLVMSSCADIGMNKGPQGAIGGAAGGAILGQAIGRNTEATLIGAALGTVLGYIVGNEMDKTDKQQLNNAYERGPSGQPVAWVNPDSGNNYQVIPQPAYTNPTNNQLCREAEILATIDGQAQTTKTTACRNAQGQWVLRN